ncbi:metal ABC transporter substrate-binding protein [Nocardioides pantholopis]|uniref:metal ABC transporter substrate-binding protein n=1 Tax=Nocardioides pantholopis TaxID=2483798 RepID=UPI000F080B46|nr:metal ABC transporter substrate-binding protein [Nocardioides pantholopis]
MSFPYRVAATALAVLAVPALAGCGAFSEDGGGSDGKPVIAAGLYPLQYVAERVAGDAFEVENLTTPGGEPHDLTLDVGETATVADSALLVHVGGLQPSVDEAAEEIAGGEVLDAATVVDLLPFDQDGHEHGEDDHGDDGHDHGEDDPHFWLDPLRMADLGDAIAERLAEIDPDGAEDFERNAADLRADLEQLDAEYAEGLADCAVTTVVTNHDAFGYLEKYGLHLESITGLSPDAEPSPAALAELQHLIETEQITTVFSESLVSAKSAETLADDAGVRTEVLDTVEGLSDETADEDYLSLMRRNLAKLQEANSC